MVEVGWDSWKMVQSESNLVSWFWRRERAGPGRKACRAGGQASGREVVRSSGEGTTAFQTVKVGVVSRDKVAARRPWTVASLG